MSSIPDLMDPTAVPATQSTPIPHAGASAAPRSAPRADWIERGSLLGLLAATAVLYLWGLSASGYANSFYAAAAQAGSQNWEAWFFGSSDAGNSITVDKPPVALWLMGLSVRLFGLSSWSILVPEAVLGVLSVGLLYATVRRSLLNASQWLAARVHRPRRYAHWTALLAAAALATTPVATLMFRFNNPDALLVFLLIAAAAMTLRAAERGSRRWLVGAGVAVGFAFLTKSLQAYIVLPVLVAAYAAGAPGRWRRKLTDLLFAFVAVVVSSGWYVALVELLPASARPYIGGSQTNSLVELIFGYNGFGRITGHEVGSVGGGAARPQGGPGVGQESAWRLFTGVSGGMVSWLIPAAVVLSVTALVFLSRAPRTNAASGEGERRHLRAALILWAGWLLLTGAVFSSMAGIYHDYYTVALAPSIAAAAALGAAIVLAQDGIAARCTLAVTLLGSAVWARLLLARAGGAYANLGWVVLGIAGLAALGLLVRTRLSRRVSGAVIAAASLALLAGPTAYAVETAATPHTGSIPVAGPVTEAGPGGGVPGGRRNAGAGRSAGQGPAGGGTAPGAMPPPGGGQIPGGGQMQGGGQNPGGGPMPGGGQNPGAAFPNGQGGSGAAAAGPGSTTTGNQDGRASGGRGGLLGGATVSAEVAALLQEDAASYTWVAATVGSQNAASYQLATQHAVMPIGGFNGSDPSPTLAQFQQLVAQGRIHYFIGGGGFQGQNGGSSASSEIAAWVQQHYTAQTVSGATLYDLTQGR